MIPTNENVSLDRVVEAINRRGHPTVREMLTALKEEFPEHVWTLDHKSEIQVAVHPGNG